MTDGKAPTYGTSTHYLEDSGVDYFEWQDGNGAVNGAINARKFSEFLNGSEIVLDFGCGGGHMLTNLNAKKRIGVEINPAARKRAALQLDETLEKVEEVPTGSIDVVVSNHALEHVPYPIQALREINRILKPGGRLLLCVPIDDWRTQRVYDAKNINHHLNTWSPQLLGNSLHEAGFKVNPQDIKVITHAWFPNYIRYWKNQRLFDFLCKIYSIRVKRRQIFATAYKL